MHFSGGFSVSMAFAILCFYFSLFTQSKTKAIGMSLLSVLVVGVVWEFFELYAGITFLSDGMIYIKDTTFDLIMDLFGGYVGILYSLKFIKTNER
jgi:VanZ family protein